MFSLSNIDKSVELIFNFVVGLKIEFREYNLLSFKFDFESSIGGLNNFVEII